MESSQNTLGYIFNCSDNIFPIITSKFLKTPAGEGTMCYKPFGNYSGGDVKHFIVSNVGDLNKDLSELGNATLVLQYNNVDYTP